MANDSNPAVTIVGAGFAGLAVAIELKRHGIRDFVILERSDDVGGVWRDNNYPGCRCDIPSSLYSYSYAQRSDWQDHYATQPEIWRYLRDVAEKFDLDSHLRFGHNVEQCVWDVDQARWHVQTSQTALSTRVLVNATGALNEPTIPNLENLDDFSGRSFHSSQWPTDFDARKRRIAVIGTGASAVQLVPQVAEVADRVVVFQRSAPWVVPRNDHAISQWLHSARRTIPLLSSVARGVEFGRRELYSNWFGKSGRGMSLVERTALRHLERQVDDPVLRSQLTPNFRIGCKRLLLSDDWYPTLQRDNVELQCDPIVGLAAGGVQTKSGDGSITLHQVDTVVFATGFAVNRLPFLFKVFNENGRSLAGQWARTGSSAYLGTTVHGFPNFAIMTGPNTGLAANSMLLMIEAQARYIRELAEQIIARPNVVVDVKADVQSRYQQEIDDRLEKSVWTASGCASWYQDNNGKVTALWPGTTSEFRRRTAKLAPSDYEISDAAPG